MGLQVVSMSRLILCIGTFLLVASCNAPDRDALGNDEGDDTLFQHWKLPKKLNEISGLALTPDERLLAVTDEEAIVYEIDYQTGELVKAFALGDPTVRGDFEGIAVLGEHVWLMTSDGRLLQTSEGGDGQRMTYREVDTGIGEYCELEGLAADNENHQLLLLCKETRREKDDPAMFRVAVSADGTSITSQLDFDEEELGDLIDKKHVKPSGLAIDPNSGQYVMVVAHHRALIAVTSDGDLIEGIILKGKGRHRQAEGIAMTRDGRLLIADEGGNDAARLAVYETASIIGSFEQ